MLGIRQDERRLVGGVVSVFALTQAGHGLGANIADTLFFLRYGVDRLPLMIVASGVAVMLALLIYAAGGVRVRSTLWIPIVIAACASWVLLTWGLITIDAPIAYPILWISTQAVMWLTLTAMWNTAESTVTIRQAKRLYPVFASAGVGGGVVGNLSTGPLTASLGTQNVLLVVAGLYLASWIALMRVRRHFEVGDIERVPMRADMAQAVRVIRSSPVLRLTIPVAISLSLLFFFVVFPFSTAVTAEFGTEVRVAGFLGLFSSITTAATFLFSILITRRLFGRFGVVASLMVVPILYALGFGMWLFSFGLATAVVFRFAQWIAVNAIEGTAFPALFNFLSGRRRAQVLALMRAVPTQIGVIASGLILLVGDRLAPKALFAAGAILAVGAALIVWRMRGAYTMAIVDAVRRGLVGVFNSPGQGVVSAVDGDVRRVLIERLEDEREGVRALAVAALAEDEGMSPRLERMMGDPSPIVRSAVFDSLCNIEPALVADHIVTALSDPEPRVRAEALRSMRAAETDSTAAIAEGVLDDPDPRVRAIAAVAVGGERGEAVLGELLDSGDPVSMRAALDEAATLRVDLDLDLTAPRRHPDVGVRASAFRLWSRRDRPDDLVVGLEDLAVGVRRAAAGTLGTTGEGRDRLMRVLEQGSVIASEAVLMALTPETKSDPIFLGWAEGEAKRAALLDSYHSALADEAGMGAMGLLLHTLATRSHRLQGWVLQAISDGRTEPVMDVVRRGIRSRDKEVRSQAIEALESVAGRPIMEVLLPLLDPDPGTERVGASEALHRLTGDFDEWLSKLAGMVLAERNGEGAPGMAVLGDVNRRETLGLVDRVIALQQVPMFSSLDPEDLELIAGVTAEAYFEPGEPVYRDGESGDEMMLIIEGEAVITKQGHDGSRREIQRYGPHQHVGELALLRGGLRGADVGAGGEGLLGITLRRDDLLSILEERPAVALTMLGTLADRLIEQT